MYIKCIDEVRLINILEYNELDIKGLEHQYAKVKEALSKRDFYSAGVKKLQGSDYYAARLDRSNRLLLQIIKRQKQVHILVLEVIRNHNYDGARFLNGGKVVEIEAAINDNELIEENIKYISLTRKSLNFLNKPISFDDYQAAIYEERLPVVIIGSAGSGKTMLGLEKIKRLSGRILYVSLSSYLIDNARGNYYAYNYSNEWQEVDFLSFNEFMATIKVPSGQAVSLYKFKGWFSRHKHYVKIKDVDKIYEEFRGTLTGANVQRAFLSEDEYLQLGVRQSLFKAEERAEVYRLFEKYLGYIEEKGLYDTNIKAYEYLSFVNREYDYLVVDEIQDLTNVQVKLLLNALINKENFLLCGDANQVVHPNFFSWSKVKSLLYEEAGIYKEELISLLPLTYRNSRNITHLANSVLRIKQQRFGSVDKESNYLMKSVREDLGNISLLLSGSKEVEELNRNSCRSVKYAIVVLTEEMKEAARRVFGNPLVFTVHEAKGLEYEQVILFNVITAADDKFREIADGVSITDLQRELSYVRAKNKGDKSLEAYKFYINAFYVAITRALESVYIVEEQIKHNFLGLLDIKQYASGVKSNTAEVSSMAEWQKEASRLAKQGKMEQAQSIRSAILQEKQVPWVIWSEDYIRIIHEKFRCNEATKEEKFILLEYALVYNRRNIIKELGEKGFKAAMHANNSYKIVKDKYFSEYERKNPTMVLGLTMKYGIDFRNQFNQTPLIAASYVGNSGLMKALLAQGADDQAVDNNGAQALHHILIKFLLKPGIAEKEGLLPLYQKLSMFGSVLNIDGKLIKLEVGSMEFFMYNTLVSLLIFCILHSPQLLFKGFRAVELEKMFAHLPELILVDRRKRRSYISHILSKNERSREGNYNRKLFMRIGYGAYVLNPEILIKLEEKWLKLVAVINKY